jgi:hypothetical protein
MEKQVKTQKEHKCAYCNSIIQIGVIADYTEFKQSVYDYDNRAETKQIGIKYNKFWTHSDTSICENYINDELLKNFNNNN